MWVPLLHIPTLLKEWGDFHPNPSSPLRLAPVSYCNLLCIVHTLTFLVNKSRVAQAVQAHNRINYMSYAQEKLCFSLATKAASHLQQTIHCLSPTSVPYGRRCPGVVLSQYNDFHSTMNEHFHSTMIITVQ